jgi:sugar/nucleoside kinase (ribokinase family)
MALWSGSAGVGAPCGPDYPCASFASRLDFRYAPAIAHTMRNWGLYETDGSRHFHSRRDSLPWAAFSSSGSALDDGPYPACHLAPMPWERVGELIAALRTRGASAISVDLHDRELAQHTLEELAALLDGAQMFFPSRQDVDVLFPGTPPSQALLRLRERMSSLPVLGVKCGADGAIVHGAGAATYVFTPAVAAPAFDATGAGDAWCGGFLSGFAATGDVVTSALRGAVAASFAVAEIGPAALAGADREQAEQRLTVLRERVEERAFR